MPRRTRPGCTTAVRTTEDDGPPPAPCRGVGGLRRHPALGIGRGPCVSTGVPRSVSRVLVSGLVSTILGAVSNAQNLGPLSAVGVGAYIALAGLWASPVSGASMNPARSLGPALASGDLHQLWIYLTAPPVGDAHRRRRRPHPARTRRRPPRHPRRPREPRALNRRFTRGRRRMSLQTLPIQRHWMGVGSTSTMALICTHGVASARCWGLGIRYVGVCLTSTGC
jgi:hypothetical protein